MPKLNLLNHIETRGVDMKSNPLLLGNKKLHSATNLTWDEGVIRTRPDFDYIPLNIEGRFQGAASYNPSKGLSYAPLSSAESGLLNVVDGAVFFTPGNSCETERISRQVFCGKGDVNVFQAEDYVIFQNSETSTYWWRGEGDIVESPGSVEEEWSDRNMPETMIQPVMPVASIPDCEQALIPNRLTVIQVCNSNSEIDDNFDVYVNDVRIGSLDLNSNAQVGSIFIGSFRTSLQLTEPDFVCPLNLMKIYRFNENIMRFGNNTLRMVNTQTNGNNNLGSIGIRSYLKTGNILSDPLVIADLTYSGSNGESFEFEFEYIDPT